MKKNKIGFLAIIALVAMSFTIASHEGAFKSTKIVANAGSCDQFVDYVAISDGTTTYTKGVDNCTTVKQLVCATGITLNTDPTFTCPNGDFFCCAKLKADQCSSNPQLQVIDKILCQDTHN